MPQPTQNWTSITHNRLITQEMNYDPQSESMLAHIQIDSLNSHQRSAFNHIWQSILGKQGKMFFVDGFGGTGKTYLYQTLCHAVRAQNIIIICVASTRLAGLLLPGGQTAHSMFKIPIDTLDEDSMCHIPKESLRAKLLKAADTIIYDECLMAHCHCFKALDRTLQDVRNCQRPFRGLTIVFGRDFQQILPVIPDGS